MLGQLLLYFITHFFVFAGASNASEDPDAPFVVKQRQPRSTVAEPRRPWKPERK